jgi:hypothetical protein
MLRIAGAGYPFVFLAAPLLRYRVLAESLSGPEDRREFTWGLDAYRVLRAHAAIADRRHRVLVTVRLRELTQSLARRAYYYGERNDRKWSRRYLCRLAVRSRRVHLTAPYLLATLLPPWVVDGASRLIGRSGGGNPTRDMGGPR